MKERLHITKEDIKAGLRQLGIKSGDIIMFHSSLSSMGYVEGGADAVIDAFLETVGEDGTVVVPTLCSGAGEAWDINNSPSVVGLITETFRQRKESIRSDNPTHSVAAIGRYAEEITKYHKNAGGSDHPYIRQWAAKGAFGPGSAWERLYEVDAKYMFLGVDFGVCTIFHYVQEVLLNDHKKMDEKAPWPEFDFVKMGRKLERRGLVKCGRIGEAITRLTQSGEMIDTSLALLRNSFLDYASGDSEFIRWYKERGSLS